MDVTLHPKAHIRAQGRVLACERASVLVRAKPYSLRLVMLLAFHIDEDAALHPLTFRFPLHSNLQMQRIWVFGAESCAPSFNVTDGFCQVADIRPAAARQAGNITVVVTVDQIPSERHTCAAWIPLGNPLLPCSITFQLDATQLPADSWPNLLVKLFYPHTRHRLCTFRGSYVNENAGVILRRRSLTLSEHANLKILLKFVDPGFGLHHIPGRRPLFAQVDDLRWVALTSSHDPERQRRLPPSVAGAVAAGLVAEPRTNWTWRLIDRSRQSGNGQNALPQPAPEHDPVGGGLAEGMGDLNLAATPPPPPQPIGARRVSAAPGNVEGAPAAQAAMVQPGAAAATDDEILAFSIVTPMDRPRPEESIVQGEDRDALLSLLSIVRSRTQDRNDMLVESPVHSVSQLIQRLHRRPSPEAPDGFVWESSSAVNQLEEIFRVVAGLPLAANDGFEAFSTLFPELEYFAQHHERGVDLLSLTEHPQPPSSPGA